MPVVKREKEMGVSVESLYLAITTFEDYPKFLPEVVGARRHEGATIEKTLVTYELEVMKRFEYTLEFSMKLNQEIKWKLVESNFFKTNEGRWLIKSKGPNETHVEYELDVSFGFLVPGWISRKLTEVSLPKMFESFETQAKTYKVKK